jgi:hypothetical protein
VPTEQDLTLTEGDDETIAITITASAVGEDLTGVDAIEVIFKPDGCADDDDAYALVLHSTVVSEALILTQSASTLTAEAYVPGTYLADPYDRVWRVVAIGSTGERRTAIHGSVTVINT